MLLPGRISAVLPFFDPTHRHDSVSYSGYPFFGDVVKKNQEDILYAEAYVVFSSRRVNTTGRGKIGWSAGAKVSNAFVVENKN